MLSKAPVVAIWRFLDKDEKAFFNPEQNLKGTLTLNQPYDVSMPGPGEILPPTFLLKKAGNDLVLFVGKAGGAPTTLTAVFGFCSVWPNGTTANLLPQRTIRECIDFATTTIEELTDETWTGPVACLNNDSEIQRLAIKEGRAMLKRATDDAKIGGNLVRKVIQSAHTKDVGELSKLLTKAETTPDRHDATPERTISFMGAIDLNALKHEPMRLLGDTGIARVRITAPVSLDLDFQRVEADGVTSFLLKKIHP